MIVVVAINLLVALLAATLSNDFLMWNSWMLYAIQLATMLPCLLRRAVYVKNLFVPSIFVLAYFLVNLTLGSYLVPRDFGWNKEFATAVLAIRQYQVIVPFLLLANTTLFVLGCRALARLTAAGTGIHEAPNADRPQIVLLKHAVYMSGFVAVSYPDVFNAFSFQLALLILHLTDPSLRGKRYRYVVEAFYLGVMLALNYENKREIAMVLFLIVFLEAYYGAWRLRFRVQELLGYGFAAGGFLALMIAASILRGYGDFPVASLVEAVTYIPQYMGSDMFVDGITDNLELNYNYGVAVTAMDHGIRGLIDYQYGASLYKTLFLPIPRDMFAYKPESMMQVFTQVYAPQWWVEEGSMPVTFAADMFLNFHYAGLIAFGLVMLWLDHLFMSFHALTPRSVAALSCLFLSITVLMFARGSGFEQWLFYCLLAMPVFVLTRLVGNALRPSLTPQARWVV